LQSLTLRGTIIAIENGAARVRHHEVPGVIAAGTHIFQLATNVTSELAPGRDFLGHIEMREGAWRLFDVRLMAAPPK